MDKHSNPLKFCSRPASPRHRAAAPLLAGMVLAALASPAYAWGPTAHRLTTTWAIQTLPAEIRGYFEANRAFLVDHSSDPEAWIKKDRYERARQYIDLDRYGRFPYSELPHGLVEARRKFGSGKVTHNGTLPWQIGEFSLRLTQDMQQQKWEAAKLDAAALGYYITDAHDPLNTTENFDGQLTGQAGLADRFGTTLIERYSNFLVFRSQDASKIADPTEYAFGIVLESNSWVDRILLGDLKARGTLPAYNEDYLDRFYTAVGSIVMRELSGAAHDIGSYWYTAWLNAGRPTLPAR
ncbi:MAG: hypothetical protein ACRD3T_12235 [Terriglobia bacterium]